MKTNDRSPPSGPASPIRAARTGTARASTSRSSRSMPSRSSCASSTRRAATSASASTCASAPTRSGTATCPRRGPGLVYGYRVHGPYRPEEATASTRTSCCSTPTRKDIVGAAALERRALRLHASAASASDLSFDRRDSAPLHAQVPRARAGVHLGRRPPPDVPWHDTVIYEMHVRGFTMQHPDVPPALRGTYAGARLARR